MGRDEFTGKKIKLHIEKNTLDRQLEKNRADLRRYYNSLYD